MAEASGVTGARVTDSDQARAVSVQLTVNRAHSAARAGDLDRAARLLDELDTGGHLDTARVSFAKADSGSDSGTERATVVAALNLRAKVHAQRGELTEADACWTRVEALAPDDPDAAAGRRTLAKIAAGRRHARPVVHTGRVAVVAAALAATVAGVALVGGAVRLISNGGDDDGGRASGSVAEADTGSERLRAESRRAAELGERLAALEADDTADAERRDSALDEAAKRLAMPGVELRRHADDIQLVFSTGVFPYDSVISAEGATALTEIGRRLADLEAEAGTGTGTEATAGTTAGVQTTVVGHSVAVPGGAPSGGSVVALERARIAAQYLAGAGDLRLTDFRLVSADQRRGPFPATDANAPRNRTVTLLITPKEPPAAP